MEASPNNRVFVIHWRDAFNIDLPEVDNEHRHLFGLVAQLDLATIGPTVEALLDYVVIHFTHEQRLMEQSGYPGFAEHLKLHEQFGTAVADFLGADNTWTQERVEELRKFLNRWLVGHIMTHDLRFGNWYRDVQAAVLRRPAVAATPHEPASAHAQRRFGWLGRLLGIG